MSSFAGSLQEVPQMQRSIDGDLDTEGAWNTKII